MKQLAVTAFILFSLGSIAQNKIKSYEYWYNGNYAGRQVQAITPAVNVTLNTAINTTGLSEGLHILNLRFKDDSARYSPTLSQFFYRRTPSATSSASINAYQYWFNNDFAESVLQTVTPVAAFTLNGPVNASALPNGLHLLHIRFRDNTNQWSSALSQFFYKPTAIPGGGTNQVTGYQYWFDQSFEGAISEAISPATQVQLSAAIPVSSLSKGLHMLNIRFRDTRMQWSGTLSQFVYVVPDGMAGGNNLMKKMQYWYDDKYNQAVTTNLAAQQVVQVTELLNTNTLSDGLHQIHLRFADTIGQWSSTISQFFYKSQSTNVTNNVITGYRYWFNNNDASKMVVHTSPAQSIMTLQTTIDMGCLTSGENRFHIQFEDKKGLWSSALTDTIGVTIPANKIYRFTGNGNWSNAANWLNNNKPALDLPGCKEIIIDHAAGGACLLDVPQYLLKSSKLTVLPGKHLVIPENLKMQ